MAVHLGLERITLTSYVEAQEVDAAPTRVRPNTLRFYVKDNGSGTTVFCFKDSAGNEFCTTTGGFVTDHGLLTGLSDDDHTQYLLLLGRSGGQTIIGGTAASNDLVLKSTSNATKGNITLVSDGGNVIIGGAATASRLRMLEPSGSGTNYTEFVTQAQGGNITYTLPPDDGDAGEQLTTNGSGSLTWEAAGGLSDSDYGDITVSSSGTVMTIDNDVVSNAKLANMSAYTIKVRNAGSSGDPSDAAYSDFGTSSAVAADWVVGFKADGTLKKYAASDFGVSSGGGGAVTPSYGRIMLVMGA